MTPHRFPRGRPGRVSLVVATLLALFQVPWGRSSSGQEPRPPAVPASRVVSLLPSATELIHALGAGDRLVGRSRFDSLGTRLGVPSVGGVVDPSLEAILARSPDLVVTWRGVTDPAVEDRLEAWGIPLYRARMEDVGDVLRSARELGALLGREGRGRTLARTIRRGLAAVRQRADLRPGPRPRVALVVDPRTVRVAGRGTFLDDVLWAAGGQNVFDDAPGPWPVVGMESLLARNPDVLVVAGDPGTGAVIGRGAWRELDAAVDGRVLLVPRERLLRPGPGVVALARELSRFLEGT